ncbi:MAG: peptide deformylase [Deltaproteobacteria bacterium]|nr:peptide deformylase [Deltaproteobacteria bacterium]NIS77058.1 peptide deformylase [Deltaproteobacteria bacterium]
MAIREILEYPDPRLKEISEPVDWVSDEIRSVVEDLIETMRASPGCVGMAAPQIGELKRIIVFDVANHRKVNSHHGLTVLINPNILASRGKQVCREGCLSVPDFTGNVERPIWILVEGLDRYGNTDVIEAEGFEAVVIQHEMDHLDGVLFLDRITSVKGELFRRKSYR